MSIWTHELLDRLRQIGDPHLDTVDDAGGWREVEVARPEPGRAADDDAGLLQHWRRRRAGAAPVDDLVIPGEPPPAVGDAYWTTDGTPMSSVRMDVAQQLFVTYGGEIGATLLLASLPHAYAAEAGAAVLTTTTELRTHTRRRIGETAQFVVEVLFPDPTPLYDRKGLVEPPEGVPFPPGCRGYVRIRTTRLTHAVIRTLIGRAHRAGRLGWDPMDDAGTPRRPGTQRGVPINQEDLLGTLGTFTVTVFDVMAKLGVPWTDEAEHAYLELWDRVGELLGIGGPEVTDQLADLELPPEYVGALRPKTPDEARELVALIQERLWAVPLPGREVGPLDNPHGRVLVRALLDELQEAMPRGMERLPLFVMRYLTDEDAHELLGLGGGGVLDSLLRWRREEPLTRRPRPDVARAAARSAMRLAANDISRRAFVHFMRSRAEDETQAPFWFPVSPDGRLTVTQGRS